MQLSEQILARNTHGGPTVMSSDPKGSEYVEWAGADDPNGGDVQIVPESIANSVPFIKAVQRGLLVVENLDENPELQQALDRQTKAYHDRTKAASEKIQESVSRETNNDMVTLPCIGPNPRGGQCGADVTVREKTKDDKPPLCTQHAGFATQYIPGEDVVDGKSVKTWVRASMGHREHQPQ